MLIFVLFQELSRGSGAVGYIVAFLLLVSLIVATWKVVSIAIGGRKTLKRGSICLGMLIRCVLFPRKIAHLIICKKGFTFP